MFSVKATDAESGVNFVQVKLDKPISQVTPDGRVFESEYLTFYDEIDVASDGMSTEQVRLSAFNASTTFSIAEVWVGDNAGNDYTYRGTELSQIVDRTSFTISGSLPDESGPTLTSLTIPNFVNLSKGHQWMSFTVGGTDDSSGLAEAWIQFSEGANTVSTSGNGSSSRFGVLLGWDGDDFSDGQSTQVVGLAADNWHDRYTIDFVELRDKAGHTTTYTAAELTALGFSTGFNVVTAPEDKTAPTLSTLTIPSRVELTGKAIAATFTVGAFDYHSGVASAEVVFDKPLTYSQWGVTQTSQIFQFERFFFPIFAETTDDQDLYISPNNQPGTYSVTKVTVTDIAGNVRVYTGAEIAALGLQSRITLTTATPDVPSTPPTEDPGTPVIVPVTEVVTATSLTLEPGVKNVVAQGSGNVTLIGNALDNQMTGNKGRNVLEGKSGKDKLNGGNGDDKLDGSIDNDILVGGSGKDAFKFTTKLGTSKTDRTFNFDTISDFSVKDDSIWLDNAIFKKLGSGSLKKPKQLDKSFFVTDKAKEKNDYLAYNKKTGVLSYDADGSGKGQAIEFAQLKKGLSLTYKDFFVI
ncbi:calcium-binding protein [Microvirga sp. Mcv34]|uniref:calcium-binding protein n=1 Tax=Microvirga sp. Mcv34 TaxID=2926016 RepID=UPI0021C8A615|nr:calcium-binding protein [Microvirga sp. Mcv34]